MSWGYVSKLRENDEMQAEVDFTVVMPFKSPDEEFFLCLRSLAACTGIENFDLLLIHNNKQKLSGEQIEKIQSLQATSSLQILEYNSSFGPSQAWCFGLRNCFTRYACLIAADTTVSSNWALGISRTVDGSVKCYQGDYSLPMIETSFLQRVEALVDQTRFFEYGTLDLRNFVIDVQYAKDLLHRRFQGRYFSDAELDLIRSTEPELAGTVRTPNFAIRNNYPMSLIAAMSRKFAHGICVGRILKKLRRPTAPSGSSIFRLFGHNLYFQIRFLHRALKRSSAISESICFTFLHLVFLAGYGLTAVLPRAFVLHFYQLHFDEEPAPLT